MYGAILPVTNGADEIGIMAQTPPEKLQI